jgi:hypothetical protein
MLKKHQFLKINILRRLKGQGTHKISKHYTNVIETCEHMFKKKKERLTRKIASIPTISRKTKDRESPQVKGVIAACVLQGTVFHIMPSQNVAKWFLHLFI